jgi:hypothetical protein
MDYGLLKYIERGSRLSIATSLIKGRSTQIEVCESRYRA